MFQVMEADETQKYNLQNALIIKLNCALVHVLTYCCMNWTSSDRIIFQLHMNLYSFNVQATTVHKIRVSVLMSHSSCTSNIYLISNSMSLPQYFVLKYVYQCLSGDAFNHIIVIVRIFSD